MFDEIISVENLLIAWGEFIVNKKKRVDMRVFSNDLLSNILSLHDDLINLSYKHSSYQRFNINDPKSRVIHKAIVRDRLLHHAVYRILYPVFDRSFIFDSYSCRLNKGTHKAVRILESFTRKVSKNYTVPCFALKCDVKKFFDSVDHKILMEILKRKISNMNVLWLLKEIICSFDRSAIKNNQLSLFGESSVCGTQTERETVPFRRGIPIGSLTSQLFANIYLNELDQFVKHKLKIKYYLRYCDDFVILSNNPDELQLIKQRINDFLNDNLKLVLHPGKASIRKLVQGIDFLGYVVLPYHTVLRTKTKKRA